MKHFIYEKPGLVKLSEKTCGQVSIQGTCSWGSSPGAPTDSNHCISGYNANAECNTGSGF